MGGNAAADLHKASNGGWSGVEDVHVVLLNDVPPSAPVRSIRSALVDHLGCTIGQRAIGHIGVTSDPTNVCGAPVNVLTLVQVEDILVRV